MPQQNPIGPLQGLTILDFTRLLPGPMATQLLAEMGATVLKIESPDSPDYIRFFPPYAGEYSAYFNAVNRSKKSLSISFSTEEGKQQIYDLVKTADVLFEQYRPGIMDKMGFGYEQLKAINPKLIYVSITGYGQTGPLAQQAGHDLNYLAISGLLSITGTKEKPVIPGMQIADVAGGSYMAVNGCLAALYARNITGNGQQVDIAMTDCIMPLMALHYAQFHAEKNIVDKSMFELSGRQANYNVYECADAKWIALGALEPKFWDKFCELVQLPEWRYNIMLPEAEMELFKQEVATLFKTKTQAEWLQMAEGKDICLTPILDLSEIEHHPHLQHRQMFVKDENGFTSIANPIKFSDFPKHSSNAAPSLGKDNDEFLKV